MQIIRALWQLRDGDRELAVDAVIGNILQIEPAGTEQEAYQAIVFGGFKDRIQIEGVFPVGIPSMYNGAIVGVLLDWGIS